MSPNNDDVVKVALTAAETAQVEHKTAEPPIAEPTAAEPPIEAKPTETVKPADIKPVEKPVEKPKPTRFDDVFKVEKPKEEKADMTTDERSEYDKLKQEKLISEHQNAYETILSAYDTEEREILQKRLDNILKEKENPEEDLFGKLSGVFSPKQVAYITTAIASLEEIGELEKIRAKKLSTAVKDAANKATKSADAKKTLQEIGNLETIGDKGELSPAEKRRQLFNKGLKGNYRQKESAIDEILKMELNK